MSMLQGLVCKFGVALALGCYTPLGSVAGAVTPAGTVQSHFGLNHSLGLVQAQYSQTMRLQVEISARRLLATARKGRPFTTPRGVKRIPIEINGETYGTLWEDTDLGSVGLGAHWESQGGMRVELVRDGRVIGMMWVEDAR